MATDNFFSDAEIICKYSLQNALEDGMLVKTGVVKPANLPVVFTSNLFSEVKSHYKEIIEKGLKLLQQPDDEDSPYMKLRVIEKNKIWVIANAEAVTFLKPEDY